MDGCIFYLLIMNFILYLFIIFYFILFVRRLANQADWAVIRDMEFQGVSKKK